jgi:SAM-dependent methyltransferase
MTYILYALALLLIVDGLRIRGRAKALPVLAPSDDPATHRLVCPPGVEVSDATLRAASAFARAHELDVLDLVPRDLPAIRALSLLFLVDPRRYRVDRLGLGRTAGHAVILSHDVAERARVSDPADDVAFVRLASKVKLFGRADIAIAPGERSRPGDPRHRYAILSALLGPSTVAALASLPILWSLIGLGIYYRPVPGLVALAAWQLQPAIALLGTALRASDLPIVTLLRFPIELVLLVRTVIAPRPQRMPSADYAQLLAGGIDRFFEPRRETCLLCDSPDLVVHQRSSDLLQNKPGTFTLERCRACGHVFQNPRLSLAGLDFYYKDFYDGMGEAGMEFIFGFGNKPYHTRARAVSDHASPARWLDVGAGHGHFCMAARDDLPETQFDGLDLSASIEEAKRRGWVDTAYRGLFPEVAPQLAGRYDAVSMSHYLEHTLDPRAELDAARTALAPSGHLMIEVPDPEFALSRVLRRWWLPYFQPQHLNLVSVKNLDRLLRERGFTPLVWHRGKAHQRVDFFFAAYLICNRLAPATDLPWRRSGLLAGAWNRVVWTIGSPFIAAGMIVDNLMGPVFARMKVSNTYRVVARKDATPAA